MPWTHQDYPDTFEHLTPEVRNKAVDIANELLEQYDEGRSIRIAMAQAKEWAENRDKRVWQGDVPEGRDLHVVPHDEKWTVEAEHDDRAEERATDLLSSKDEAIDKAKKIASDNNSNVVIHNSDGQIEDVLEPS